MKIIPSILPAIVLLLAAARATAAPAPEPPSPPFQVDAALFNHQQPDTLGLREIPGAETVTVFAPAAHTDKFSHGVQLCAFNGWLHAMWQSCARDEDTFDSRVMWSRSRDGRAWAPPVELAPAPGDGKHLRSTGGFWTDGRRLVAYIIKTDSWSPGTIKQTEARVSLDGENWSPIQPATSAGTTSGRVGKLPGGRLLAGIHAHLPGSEKMFGMPAWSDAPDGLGEWRVATMPRMKDEKHPHYGRGIEPSWFLRADGRPVMVFRDSNRSGRSLASLGSPDGASWTEPVVSDLPDSTSLQCAGNLPDGSAYLVNNPTGTRNRFPLAITLSADGKRFTRAFLLRHAPPPKRFEGKHKDTGFSYPSATLWGDRLCVAYATNKEDVEITFVPLEAIF